MKGEEEEEEGEKRVGVGRYNGKRRIFGRLVLEYPFVSKGYISGFIPF